MDNSKSLYTVPEEIKKQIEDAGTEYSKVFSQGIGYVMNGYLNGGEFGYSLASKEIEELKRQHKESLLLYQNMCEQITKDQAEIERLKGLVKNEWLSSKRFSFHSKESINNLWDQFKYENNL